MQTSVTMKRPRRPNGQIRPGRPTREQVERRNQELLDQALDLFLEHGFEATTIDAISTSLGMSRRTIYARYGDKTALFKAALQRAIDEWVIPLERLHAAETDSLEETLTTIARMWVANMKKPSGMRLVQIANIEMFRMPDVAAYLWERTAQPTLAYLTDLFERRLRPGATSVSDAADAAVAFLLLVMEGSVQWGLWRKISDAEFDRQIVYRTRLFLHGAHAAKSPSRDGTDLLRRLERLERVVQARLGNLDSE